MSPEKASTGAVPVQEMSPKSTRVTNRIRELRAAAGDMSQARLAAEIGVTRQTIIAIEKGSYSPSLETAFRISRALGQPLDGVFSFPGDDEGPTPTTQQS